MRTTIFTALFAMLSSNALAEDGVFFSIDGRKLCNGTTFEMSRCIAVEAQKANQVLNNIYASFQTNAVNRNGIDESYQRTLMESLSRNQSVFLNFRSSMSELSYVAYHTGSIRNIMAPSTELELTVNQIRHLLSICAPNSPYQHAKRFELNKTDWCNSGGY